ncbi:hypothetical protein [Paenibacillus lutrae]|uniref:Pectate lyase superfamily protein domain-containing protein n=1 Tax=Paenibacillus lutrae TaxID=2078573 RepID=A0A7X3FJA4_9BACL|nr:hypothetical protein [Paenibacillus lutrae]MVP00347.1 hypothetical protein [Paenibacillus lutrae]
MGQNVAEQMQLGFNSILNYRAWNEVTHIVSTYGIYPGPDVTVKLQELVNKAIAEGRKAIFFPRGDYYVTSLVNAEKVVFFGDNARFVGGYSGIIQQLGNVLSYLKTTGNISLFVAPTGSNSNDGLSSGTALKSFNVAVSRLPQIINHVVTINVAPGLYDEDFSLGGFTGSGVIRVLGAGSLTESTNYKIRSFGVANCLTPAYIRGFEATITEKNAFLFDNSYRFQLDICRHVITATIQGATAKSAMGVISGCEFSGKYAAIASEINSKIYSTNNSGSGNTFGLLAIEGGTISKYLSQPTGGNDATFGGGVIR